MAVAPRGQHEHVRKAQQLAVPRQPLVVLHHRHVRHLGPKHAAEGLLEGRRVALRRLTVRRDADDPQVRPGHEQGNERPEEVHQAGALRPRVPHGLEGADEGVLDPGTTAASRDVAPEARVLTKRRERRAQLLEVLLGIRRVRQGWTARGRHALPQAV